MAQEKIPPVYPGEVLFEDFLKPMGISQEQLAGELNLDEQIVYEIIQNKQHITTDIALRLARFFGTSPELWLNLQSHYDLETAKDKLQDKINQEVQPYAA